MISVISEVAFGVPDPIGDPAVGHHDLYHGNAPAPDAGDQPLADHPSEDTREGNPNLMLVRGREEVHDAVDGLHGVGGVQGGKHQVTGLPSGQGCPHRLVVPHLPDQDDVGVLAHGRAHGLQVAVGVQAELPLGDCCIG